MAEYHEEDLLIVAKTYPTPSTKYRETTCVGAINSFGIVRRLYPIPFRLLEGDKQFRKWEWIRARIAPRRADRRPESRYVDAESIVRLNRMPTRGGWGARMEWVEPHIVPSFEALEARRISSGETMGFVRPSHISGLDITPEEAKDWSPKEWENLRRLGLFDSRDARARPLLRKIPYAFHYRYTCELSNGGAKEYRHKLTDWEAGALFWNCFRDHGPDWQEPFRLKMESEMKSKDTVFFLGTVHRFPGTWVIASVVYPPKPTASVQKDLPLSWD
jgi:hypothetical protein